MAFVNFQDIFINVDFEEKLNTACDLSILDNKTFKDYTDYRLAYLSEAKKNHGRFKELVSELEMYKEMENVSETRRIFTFINKPEYNRLSMECKKLINVQRQHLDSFVYFIDNIQTLDSIYKARAKKWSRVSE
jgi:hypothetical protein